MIKAICGAFGFMFNLALSLAFIGLLFWGVLSAVMNAGQYGILITLAPLALILWMLTSRR